jgi:hypothetical protein
LTGRHRTRQDRTGQDRTGQDRTGRDRTGQHSTGQDRIGQNMTYLSRKERTAKDRIELRNSKSRTRTGHKH